MAGLRKDDPVPIEIKVHQRSRLMEVSFDDGQRFEFSFEFLRVFSPSAEVRGHGIGQEVLQLGKRDVNIVEIRPVGQYGVTLVFDDGHDTGIYSWDTLYTLGRDHDRNWADYLAAVEASGGSR